MNKESVIDKLKSQLKFYEEEHAVRMELLDEELEKYEAVVDAQIRQIEKIEEAERYELQLRQEIEYLKDSINVEQRNSHQSNFSPSIEIHTKLVENPELEEKIKNFTTALQELPSHLDIAISLGNAEPKSNPSSDLKINLEQIIIDSVEEHFKKRNDSRLLIDIPVK